MSDWIASSETVNIPRATLPWLLFSEGQSPWPMAIGLRLNDEATVRAIRQRDPRLLDTLDALLDEADQIGLAKWADEWLRDQKYHTWEQGPFAGDLDALLRGLADNKYASEEIRHEARRGLARHIRRDITERRRRAFSADRDALLLGLIDRDGCRCAECGSEADLTIDHIVPVSRGGTDDLGNLRLLCRPCNSKKGDRLGDDHQP